ncbi:hypothetical protein MY4824_002121 [Beauveria thailandica]
MRIGCLQFAPKVGDVDNNINRADAVLSRADVEELDLLVLPELAFTGYNFKSLNQIAPYLEPSGSGITSLWARTVALKYNCTVIAGYPEKVDVTPKWPTSPEYYNSAIVVSPDGETIANYRKSFLYYTDETWALEGDGFYSGFLPSIGFASLGICMDLNPYKFEAPWHEYEFAFHALDVSANVVIVSMAWMTREEPREFSRMPNEPDLETLTYWITRLEPLVRADRRDEIIVVFVNRCGIEGDATYAGTSAVLGIHHGQVTVYGLLGRGEKQLLVVDTMHPPYCKLLYRPECPNKLGVPHDHGKLPTSELDSRDFGVSDKESESFYGALDSDSPRKDTDSQGPCQEADGAGTPVALDWPYNSEGLATSTSQPRQVEGTSNSGQVKMASSIVKLQITAASKAIKKPPTAPTKLSESVPLHPADNVQTPHEDGTRSAPIQVMHSPQTAVRPKLAIPQSPSMIPQQLYSSQSASAASAMSGKSTNPIRLEDSQASAQTIRSNPRQPEDNTLYPPGGAQFNRNPEWKQTYGGSVAVRSEDQSLAPVAAFEDMSPASSAYRAWPQSLHPVRSLDAAGAWLSDTPLEIPEPFSWSSMGGLSRPRSHSTRGLHSNGEAPARRTIPPVTDWYKLKIQSDPHQAINEAINEWKHVSRNFERPESDDRDAESARPASPKSRNASRSRLHERPGSAMGRLDLLAAAQHLENVVKRVSSIPRLREKQEYSEIETYFDAAFSSESRGNSLTKKRDTQNAIEPNDTAMPVAASPGLLDVEVQRHAMPRRIPEPRFAPAPVQRPAKRNSHKVKRNSITSPIQRPSTAPLPFDPPTPKAMAFIPDAGELNSPEEDGLVLTTTIKGKFVDTQNEMGVQRPVLA